MPHRLLLLLVAIVLIAARPGQACVGDGCISLYSTEPGGGALTTTWDFATRKIQTFKSFCAGGECLYSTIDPGFLPGGTAAEGFYSIADGTRVLLNLIDRDPAVTLRLNGLALAPGAPALVGVTPELHNHPSWQLKLPEGMQGEYWLDFTLTTDSGLYSDSQVFRAVLTNLPTPTVNAPTPSATPTATPSPPACPGDCNGDGETTVDEIVRGVGAALGNAEVCAAADLDGDGAVSISELVAAVSALLNGCAATPTPTATLPVTLETLQRTIFSPRCALIGCHDSQVRAGNMTLEAGRAYAQLVCARPSIDTAREAGFFRVDPRHPENSFLLQKLNGPPPDQGSAMPLSGPPLTSAEKALVRDWIAAGADGSDACTP